VEDAVVALVWVLAAESSELGSLEPQAAKQTVRMTIAKGRFNTSASSGPEAHF